MGSAETPAGGAGIFSLLSFRRPPSVHVEPNSDDAVDLDAFHSSIAQRLISLLIPHDQQQPSPPPSLPSSPSSHSGHGGGVISMAFLYDLLDSLLAVDVEFCELLAVLTQRSPVAMARQPAEKLCNDFLSLSVKFLDLLNAVSQSLYSARSSLRLAAIAAAGGQNLNPARSRRALSKLFPPAGQPMSRTGSGGSHSSARTASSVGRHHMHVPAPSLPAGAANSGVALALYTFSSFLAFAMWVLTAAVTASAATPPPVSPPKNMHWAASMSTLQERIYDEWRKRKGGGASGGLLAEMAAVETAAKGLMQCLEESEGSGGGGGPLIDGERDSAVISCADELGEACRAMEGGLPALERQVRAVFHRMVTSQSAVLHCMEQSGRAATAITPPGTSTAPAAPHPL